MALSLESIFSSGEFSDEGFDRPRWCPNGSHYTTLRRVGEGRVREVILHHPGNENVQTLVGTCQLYPAGAASALIIDDYTLSNDQTKVLLFSDSRKVWRLNTKGSYWILCLGDPVNTSPYRLGATLSNPNDLMFATFSPCNEKVAYVFENNIYCEELSTHRITQLTHDGNENIINGNFDWVYEEEFHLRNGFRFSSHLLPLSPVPVPLALTEPQVVPRWSSDRLLAA
jgi:dipeptidyl-peptidase 4